MLSWITGSKDTFEAEPDGNSFVEPPETPAPVFVVKAFKQAIFGTPTSTTPAPNNANALSKPTKIKEHITDKTKSLDDSRLDELSRPNGILLTPGTVGGRRKQVTFGAKVINNEGKTSKYSKTGLPDDIPGKFPSPFTPRLHSTAPETVSSSSSTVKKQEKPSAEKQIQNSIVTSKSDVDATCDLDTPKSSSAKYWQEQYEMYAARSEVEMKRLIAKHKLAKDYAKMKDEESLTWQSRYEMDQKKYRDREKSLSHEIQDLRDRLRISLAENTQIKTEIAVLKRQAVQYSVETVKPTSQTNITPPTPDDSALGLWIDDDADAEESKPNQRLGRRRAHSQLRSQTKSTTAVNDDKSDDLNHSKSKSTPLGEISANVPSTAEQRVKQVRSKSSLNHALVQPSPWKGETEDTQMLNLETLKPKQSTQSIQSLRPVTPSIAKVTEVKKRTPRSGGGSKMENARQFKAAERIAQRRKSRAATRTTPLRPSVAE